MIFAELEYQKHYSDVHAELLAVVDKHFSRVQSGLQGDSWIWIFDGEEKVAIDTFTSMKHQIKSAKAGAHVRNCHCSMCPNSRSCRPIEDKVTSAMERP